MRALRMAALAVLMSGLLWSFMTLPTLATVLSVGTSNQTFGGYVCADVAGGSLAVGTPVNAYDCNVESNQQFELVPVEVSHRPGQPSRDSPFMRWPVSAASAFTAVSSPPGPLSSPSLVALLAGRFGCTTREPSGWQLLL